MSKKVNQLFSARTIWLSAIGLSVLALALSYVPPSSANHPVLVEGNCDSPVPGTTIVQPGTCGDFDGDGRIGTAEDTDGADRIFGTIGAAIGQGTGAAAGTGANQNGRVTIVASGRFPEALVIATSGHLQLEAAPGVDVNIDAILQGDPGGGNLTRTEAVGVLVSLDPGATTVLRNLTIRNWAIGVKTAGAGRLLVENCRIENNRDYGIQALGEIRLIVERSTINATGRRVGVGAPATSFGHGIQYSDLAAGIINKSLISNSLRAGINNISSRNTIIFETVLPDNDGGANTGTQVIKGTY